MGFDPKDDDGKPAEGNSANLYDKTANAFSFEGGFKVLVSDRVSINISANPYIISTDYLDDIAAAFENESYTSVLVGFSYSPFVGSDSDGDGVGDSEDMCPETPYGISVDEFGCLKGDEIVSEQKITIPGDNIFPPNSAMIKIEGKKYLDEVILQIQKFTDKQWRIDTRH